MCRMVLKREEGKLEVAQVSLIEESTESLRGERMSSGSSLTVHWKASAKAAPGGASLGLPSAIYAGSDSAGCLQGRWGWSRSYHGREGQSHSPQHMRVPAYMLPHTGGRTDPTDKFPRMQGHTETQDAVPLPYSKEEPWTQTLGSPANRHKYMRTYFS